MARARHQTWSRSVIIRGLRAGRNALKAEISAIFEAIFVQNSSTVRFGFLFNHEVSEDGTYRV
jgi:hypothetical protein